MFFGATSFSEAPFSSQYKGYVISVNGSQINAAIGNTTVRLVTNVPVTGYQIKLATDTVGVVSWNRIVPGATGIWIPIDPDNP